MDKGREVQVRLCEGRSECVGLGRSGFHAQCRVDGWSLWLTRRVGNITIHFGQIALCFNSRHYCIVRTLYSQGCTRYGGRVGVSLALTSCHRLVMEDWIVHQALIHHRLWWVDHTLIVPNRCITIQGRAKKPIWEDILQYLSTGNLCKLALVHWLLRVLFALNVWGWILTVPSHCVTCCYTVGHFICNISMSFGEQIGDTAWRLELVNLKSLTLFIMADRPQDVLIEVYYTLMGGLGGAFMSELSTIIMISPLNYISLGTQIFLSAKPSCHWPFLNVTGPGPHECPHHCICR